MVSTNDGERNMEQYGMSLKLNGEVRNMKFVEEKEELNSFQYQTRKLRNLQKQGQEKDYFKNEKDMVDKYWYGAINIVSLKYFLLELDNENYNPEQRLVRDLNYIAGYNKGPSAEGANEWYELLAESFFDNREYKNNLIEEKLSEIRRMLLDYLKNNLNKEPSNIPAKKYTRYMTFLKSILAKDLFAPDRVNILRHELATHNYKYIILTKEILEDSLFHLKYEVEFTNTFLCSEGYHEEITFCNEIHDQDEILPIIFLPYDPWGKSLEKQPVQFTQQSKDVRKVCILYPTYLGYESPVEEFIFVFVYKLFVYLFLVAYFEQIHEKKPNLFLSFWHFHQLNSDQKSKHKNHTEMGGIIRQFTKELEFLFGMDMKTGSQGFRFGDGNTYKLGNTLQSMYVNIPKVFTLDTSIDIPKIAIVVITSMKTDFQKGDQYRTGVFGEVYTIDSSGKTSKFQRSDTFFDHYNETVYEQSKVLVDVIQKLYDAGYKHILYIAKTPYQTKFLNKKNGQIELYFMNQKLMESLYVEKDMAIYPMHVTFTRAYEARFGGRMRRDGLFVEDTSHIQENLYKDHVGIVPVLQLYSGYSLPVKNDRHVYNSLITYQTWSQIYSNEHINQKIQSDLIDPKGIKPHLIRSLLLLHTSQFQSDRNPTLKVDPYSELLGDDGVARKSMWEISWANKTFSINMLAYLSYLHTKVFEYKGGEGRE
jgi:hypothetical protein